MGPALSAEPGATGAWSSTDATSPPTRWERLTSLGPRVIDVSLVGAVAAAALFDFFLVNSVFSPGRATLGAVVTLGTLTVVLVRRQAPVVALATLIVVIIGLAASRFLPASTVGIGVDPVYRDDVIPFTTPVVALAGLVTPVVRRERARIAVGLGAAAAVAVAILLVHPFTPLVRLVFGGTFVGLLALGIGVGVYLRDLDRRTRDAAVLARRDERIDIARDLHDLVAHYVSAIVVEAQAAKVVADRDLGAAGTALDRIEGAGREALDAMRGLVGSLRGEVRQGRVDSAPTAPPVGLAGLDDLAATSTALGVPVHVELAPDIAGRLSGVVAAAVHRIVQESLTNVRRHAVEATVVAVTVELDDPGQGVVVTVTDDGRVPAGAGRTERWGFGIVGMTERAEALGGTLRAGEVEPPARGWRVQATFPAPPRASVG